MQCEIINAVARQIQGNDKKTIDAMHRRFRASMHPNSVAAELQIDPKIVFAAYLAYRSVQTVQN